jgi:hypothetical protein
MSVITVLLGLRERLAGNSRKSWATVWDPVSKHTEKSLLLDHKFTHFSLVLCNFINKIWVFGKHWDSFFFLTKWVPQCTQQFHYWISLWWFRWEWPPYCIWMSGSQLVELFGKDQGVWPCWGKVWPCWRRCGLVGGDLSLGIGVEVSQAMHARLSLSLVGLHPVGQKWILNNFSSMPACCHALCHDDNGLILWTCKPAPSKRWWWCLLTAMEQCLRQPPKNINLLWEEKFVAPGLLQTLFTVAKIRS